VFKGFFGKLLYRINNIDWDWKYHFIRAWRKNDLSDRRS